MLNELILSSFDLSVSLNIVRLHLGGMEVYWDPPGICDRDFGLIVSSQITQMLYEPAVSSSCTLCMLVLLFASSVQDPGNRIKISQYSDYSKNKKV